MAKTPETDRARLREEEAGCTERVVDVDFDENRAMPTSTQKMGVPKDIELGVTPAKRELLEGGDTEIKPSAITPEDGGRRTEIQRVALADGTKIDKQIVDFKDTDTAAEVAKEKADYIKKMEAMSEEERDLFKLSEPIPLTRLMANLPCCVVLFSFALMLVVSIFVAYMGWLLPEDPTDRDYFMWGDPYVNNFDKSKLAVEEL